MNYEVGIIASTTVLVIGATSAEDAEAIAAKLLNRRYLTIEEATCEDQVSNEALKDFITKGRGRDAQIIHAPAPETIPGHLREQIGKLGESP